MNTPGLDDSGLKGGIAVVTGGSRGIGRAIVEILSEAGMTVVFTYRENKEAASQVASAEEGGKISAHPVDVCDAAATEAFIERIVEQHGRIDLLVNNAGVIRDNLLAMMPDEDVRAVLETNVVGAFNMARAVAPHMISKRRGCIINISSISGEKGGRGQTNYAASKGAINAFTKSLAAELAPRGIRVNAVAPGVIDTDMSKAVRALAGDTIMSKILLRRIGRPADVAYAVWFLSSRFAEYITGEILHVDGGFKME